MSIELNSLIRNTSRSRVIKEFSKKSRHCNSNKPRLESKNLNDATEDTSSQIVRRKVSQLNPVISLSNNGTSRKSPLEAAALTVGRRSTARAAHELHNQSDLVQLIDEKDSLISKMTREKHLLETELNALRQKTTQSLLHKITKSKAMAMPVACRNAKSGEVEEAFKYRAGGLCSAGQSLTSGYATRRWQCSRVSIGEINAKLASGLHLVENLEKCIMGMQCDMKLLEAKANPGPRGIFSDDLQSLKEKIRTLVTIADKRSTLSYATNV